MNEMDKIRAQVLNGQGLTGMQAQVLWEKYAEVCVQLHSAMAPATQNWGSALGNIYDSIQWARGQAHWRP